MQIYIFFASIYPRKTTPPNRKPNLYTAHPLIPQLPPVLRNSLPQPPTACAPQKIQNHPCAGEPSGRLSSGSTPSGHVCARGGSAGPLPFGGRRPAGEARASYFPARFPPLTCCLARARESLPRPVGPRRTHTAGKWTRLRRAIDKCRAALSTGPGYLYTRGAPRSSGIERRGSG